MTLTHTLSRTLRDIRAHDGEDDFILDVITGRKTLDGYGKMQLVLYVAELDRAGMLHTVDDDDGVPTMFYLTAEGRDYHANRRRKALRKIVVLIVNIVAGASGGLVVWLLTWATQTS